MSLPLSPEERLREAALGLGFGWFGIARARGRPEDEARLREWIGAGRHGSMEWLAREPGRRADPTQVLEGCESVVVVGLNYLREPILPRQRHDPAPGHGRVSRYARTRDYHRVIEKALRKMARLLDTEICPGARSRGYVDYGPVMERPWAVEAGLGFIGKHTLLIHPEDGSFHFLGVLLTTAPLEPISGVHPSLRGCGDCRRCIEACPTGAITEPWQLDARKCISYLTIEKKGPLSDEEATMLNGWLVGCDVCQEVCPYNGARAKPVVGESALGEAFVPAELRLTDLIDDAEGLLERLPTSSPLRRVGADGLRRNALIAQRAEERRAGRFDNKGAEDSSPAPPSALDVPAGD
jgi:epoxyqueuosine reductase